MTSKKLDNPIIAVSATVYRVLLFAYPTRFQQAYGSQMMQVFQDCCLRSFRQDGLKGLCSLWAITLLDFVRSVFEQHMQKEADMSTSRLVRWSGWALILGAVAFIAILQGSDSVAMLAAEISATLLAIALLGLRARYGEQVGSFGRNSLLLGATGPFLMVIVIALGLVGIVTQSQMARGFWILLFGGPAIVLLGLTLFGLAALERKPMSRWNWLPIVAGVWYPITFILFAGSILTHDGAFDEAFFQQYYPVILLMFLIHGIALCLLGFMLIGESRQEMATT